MLLVGLQEKCMGALLISWKFGANRMLGARVITES